MIKGIPITAGITMLKKSPNNPVTTPSPNSAPKILAKEYPKIFRTKAAAGINNIDPTTVFQCKCSFIFFKKLITEQS